MLVRVRLFAMLRERAGSESLELDLRDGATAGTALEALAERPELNALMERMPMVMAVNREYATPDCQLQAGDELALIPPVSGGATETDNISVSITDEALDAGALSRLVGRPGAGAVVTFCGTTRDVDALTYEAYAEMAHERCEAILSDCMARHGLKAAAVQHRIGRVELGEPSVVVAVSAAHRAEAFAGARDAIDAIKSQAPIWKQEIEGDETRWVAGEPPA